MGDHEAPRKKDGGPREVLGPKKALSHLIAGCRKGRISRAAARQEALDPGLTAAYDPVLDQAEEFARRAASLPVHEVRRFKQALDLLRSKKDDGVRALTKGGMDVKGEGVYEALLLRSWTIRYDDPQMMCHLAKVAVEMCDTFDPKACGAKRIADLRARAWGELGNAYRVANRYREAEGAFGESFYFLRQGSGDRELKLRLMDLEASLLGTLRQFELALQRMAVLSNMYREDGDLHLAGRALITKALYTYYNGDTEKCLPHH